MTDRHVTQSDDTKYAQVISSPRDTPERDGRSLVTTDHEVIQQWAKARDAVPSTIEGTEREDRLGVLRFDFQGGDSSVSSRLRHVSWNEWFKTFDSRNLNFVYQETRTNGSRSNFFRLENPSHSGA